MATQDNELVTAEGARKLFDRYRDTAGGGVVLADVTTSGHMTSIPLSDSIRNYRVVDVFVSFPNSGNVPSRAYTRVFDPVATTAVNLSFLSSYAGSSLTYLTFTSDTALGLMPNYVYINDGISFLIIGYNFA